MKMIDLINNLKTDWKNILFQEDTKDILDKISQFVDHQRKTFKNVLEIFPPEKLIFNAFNHFDFKELKVVILGQDCYHGKGQANGLCFSVPEGMKIPPSLRNILKEMKNDIGCEIQTSDFTYLAKQGVLFMNCAMTVREKSPLSHAKVWKPFSDHIIKYISNNSSGIIFILWGSSAKSKEKFINKNKHFILKSHHPSPLSANRGGWFGCCHFSKMNKLLLENGKKIINW